MLTLFILRTIPSTFSLKFIYTTNFQRIQVGIGQRPILIKQIVDFKFKFDYLTKGENILTKIRTRINEELEKKKKNSCNLTFNSGFIKIIINCLILHPPDVGERMMAEFYKERRRGYESKSETKDNYTNRIKYFPIYLYPTMSQH